MFKQLMALLLFVSAIFVFYPLFNDLNALNTLGLDNTLVSMLIFGVILIYVFAFSVLAWLPASSSLNVKDLVDVEDCPSCGEESLNKVRLNVAESSDSAAPRKLALNVEYCTGCKKISVDGQEIRKGGLYDYIEDSLISVYGNKAPMEKNESFNTKDFDELLIDIDKAKKAKSKNN